MFFLDVILAWINIHIYALFRDTTGVVKEVLVQDFVLDMTFLYKIWEDHWSKLEVISPCYHSYRGTGIAMQFPSTYQYAALPGQYIYGVVPHASGSVAESLTLGYVYRK